MRGVNLQIVRARVERLAGACQKQKLHKVTLEMLVAASLHRDGHSDVFPPDIYDVGPGSLVALVAGVQQAGAADAR